MLDLNYVEKIWIRCAPACKRAAFRRRALDNFAAADASAAALLPNRINSTRERNAASREIGELMKGGKRDEAEGRRKEVNELKERIARTRSLARRGGDAHARSADILAKYSA